MIRIIIVSLLIMFSFKSFSQSKSDWIEDLEFLKTTLPKKHKNLFFKLPRTEFEHDINSIINGLDSLDNNSIQVKLQILFAKIGDSHTSFQNKFDKSVYLPIYFNIYDDGVFTIGSPKEILGKKVIAINGIPITTILDSLSVLIVNDNPSMLLSRLPYYLSSTLYLRYFGFLQGEIINYSLLEKDSIIKNYTFLIDSLISNKKEIAWIIPQNSKYPFFSSKNNFYWSSYDTLDSVYYIRYQRCVTKSTVIFSSLFFGQSTGNRHTIPSFHKFKRRILDDLRNIPVKKLIFDLRNNGGGASQPGTYLINRISKLKHINQKGKIFVIVNRKTFSSAFFNMIDFKKYTKAIIIGEPPSQKPNSFGDIRQFDLPKSGITVYYSVKYFELIKDDINIKCFEPDIVVPFNFSEFSTGIDRAYIEAINFNDK